MRDDAISRFCGAVGSRVEAETIAAAFAEHLGQMTASALPASAQAHWRDVARLLKSPAEKPVPDKAIGAIRSWPAARLTELLALTAKTDAILERLENERLEDEIRDKIRRHYL
jgi:hypothetical protein